MRWWLSGFSYLDLFFFVGEFEIGNWSIRLRRTMSRTAIHPQQFQSLFSHSRCKCPRIAVSWTMTMDSEFSSPTNNRTEKEASVQLSSPRPLVSRVET
ncbi:hypothetical protein SESBI_40478 [Sesbania bispinosa]|nr:hypothetical protein SESBI_40478 [Sesbania bispinosa]